jgi:hypothetical protein
LPTTIVFADYGTKKIASSTTYELKVKTNKKQAKVDNSKKGMAVFNIKPSNAILLIDGQIADGSGGVYTLSLPYGTHYYTVKLKDFSINNQSVQIDKNAKSINVDLTEFFAKVDVSCKTEDADILINNEQKGVGKWGGMMIPGKYNIEAQKDGCHSQSRQVELKDNDTIKVEFTALKTITGSLRVDYEPAGADVLLNGKKVGVTPLEIKELPVGEYHMEIWKEYYVKDFATVKIAEDQEWKETGELKLTQFGELVVKSQESKEISALHALAGYYRYGAYYCEEPNPQYMCQEDTVYIPYNPVKAIFWYKKMYNEAEGFWKDWAKEALGPCFPSNLSDEEISFCWAKEAVKTKSSADLSWYYENPRIPLAWHYFYGIGCEKNVEYGKRLIRTGCTKDGEYIFPALQQIIKEMNLDGELKYNPNRHPTDEELGYDEYEYLE